MIYSGFRSFFRYVRRNIFDTLRIYTYDTTISINIILSIIAFSQSIKALASSRFVYKIAHLQTGALLSCALLRYAVLN